MAEATGSPTPTPGPDAPPPPVAAPPPPVAAPPPPLAVSPAAASTGPSGATRWIVPAVAGIVTSMVVQIILAQLGLGAASLLLPVGLGLVAGTFVAGRLAKVTTAGGWITAGLLVFVGQIIIGLIILQLFLQ